MKNKINWLKVATVTFFLSIPLASSIISTIHIIDFFELGNPSVMALVLAGVIELGSIASLLALANMHKLKMAWIWFIFVILFTLQIIGNIFFTFKFVSEAIITQPKWLQIFTEFMQVIGLVESAETGLMKLILSLIIGLPVPLISLSFLKSTVDYLKPDEIKVDQVTEIIPISENVIESTIQEIVKEVQPEISNIDSNINTIEDNINKFEVKNINDIEIDSEEKKKVN